MEDFSIQLDDAQMAQEYSRPVEKPCRAKFFRRSKQISLPDGKKEYRDVEMIRIWIDSKNVLDEVVNDQHKATYFNQYRHFIKTGDNQVDGTPLSAWPGITIAQIENLKLRQIYSVEQLAEVKASDLDFLGGAELKHRAEAYLVAKKDTGAAENFAAVAAGLKEQNESLRAEKAEREAELAKMAARLAALEAASAESVEQEAPARRKSAA